MQALGRIAIAVPVLAGLVWVASCSASGSSSKGSGGSGTGGNGGSGGTSFDSGDGAVILTPDSACAAETRKAEPIPLDLYIMLDKSGSMDDQVDGGTDSKWGLVTTALTNFVSQSPATDGIGVGIQYFPSFVPKNPCQTNADCGGGRTCLVGTCLGNWPGACTVTDYSTPAVPIEVLPGAKNDIVNSLLVQGPNGGTPTSAALEGAIAYATSWAQTHADHTVIVVLATDGDPSECELNIGPIAALALSGANATPPVATYVIGVGNLASNLNQIAKAGGTNAAFILDPAADVGKKFLDAMNEIRKRALGCDYLMPTPEAGTIDPGKVNVLYTPSGAAPQTLPQVASATACGTKNGWYYDDALHPTRILICPGSCTTLQADTTGKVDVLVGCATVVE